MAITGQGKTRGTTALLGIEATINQHIAYIAPRTGEVNTRFLQLALAAAYQTLRSMSDDAGSTKGALTCEAIKQFKVPLPPINEQDRILQLVEAETRTLKGSIRSAEHQISLLREYRTRLISDVVTGKFDVRAVAASFPDDPEDDASPIDDTPDDEAVPEEDIDPSADEDPEA